MEIDKAKRMYGVDTGKVLHTLKKRKEQFKKENGGQVPKFFKYITEDERENTVELEAVINSPLSFLYDAVSSYRSQHKKPGKHFIIIVNDRLSYLKTSAGELKYEGDLLTLVTDNSKYTFKIIDDKERKVNECQNADRPATELSEKEATADGKPE